MIISSSVFSRAVLAVTAFVVLAPALSRAGPQQEALPRFQDTLVVTATPMRGGSPSDYFMTFSGPVGVPGVSLPAGTYLFRFPSDNAAHVIQVLKADRSDAYSQFLTIPVQDVSRGLSSNAAVTWRERRADAPPAIAAWFPPGQSTGWEFIYPKQSQPSQ
jgi:hypothetical protein